jgi:hypothetical protein
MFVKATVSSETSRRNYAFMPEAAVVIVEIDWSGTMESDGFLMLLVQS